MREQIRRRVSDREAVTSLRNAIKEISNGNDVVLGALAWIKHLTTVVQCISKDTCYIGRKRADIKHILCLCFLVSWASFYVVWSWPSKEEGLRRSLVVDDESSGAAQCHLEAQSSIPQSRQQCVHGIRLPWTAPMSRIVRMCLQALLSEELE